jgi:hypothetical protein
LAALVSEVSIEGTPMAEGLPASTAERETWEHSVLERAIDKEVLGAGSGLMQAERRCSHLCVFTSVSLELMKGLALSINMLCVYLRCLVSIVQTNRAEAILPVIYT